MKKVSILLIFLLVFGFGNHLTFAESQVPEWIFLVFSWYDKGKISDSEFMRFLEFLDEEKIIDSVLLESIFDSEFKPNYVIMVTKGEKHIVPLDKIKKGGPPPDGIPSIDNPKFVLASEADYVDPNELIIGVFLNGDAKAYPLSIMNWHEIVNDKFGDIPVAVTYCPLCFTSQVFVRTIDQKPVEFGTSGMLYNSNLVMYDRLTESLWSQGLGVSIKGDLSGEKLKTLPFDVMSWSDWASLYPDSLVLTKDTGHQRPYSSNPYSDYFKDPRILFSIDNEDDRLPKKEIIFGVENNGNYKAFKKTDVESKQIINDSIGGKKILVISTVPYMARVFDRAIEDQILDFQLQSGKIIDIQTNSIWNIEGESIDGPLKGTNLKRMTFHPGFWFEWATFHPQTQIYSND